MKKRLTRREALQLAVYGSLGGLAAACTPAAAPAPTAQPAPPTAVPPAATTAPTVAVVEESAEEAPTAEAPAATEASPEPTPEPTIPALITNIGAAATGFLAALDDNQRARATYAFEDAERLRWHWTTPRNFPRNGLPLREMSAEQRELALGLLHASVSDFGFQKALDIISLQNDLGNDPELYYVTVFGTPGGAESWGWRFEGHHLSRHITVANGGIAVMPFFLGAWPTVNNAGLVAMEREEWAARELITSLVGPQREGALFSERTLGRHVTDNAAYATPPDEVGVLAAELNDDQRGLILEIVQNYLNTLPGDLGAAHYESVLAGGVENVRFGWAGSTEPRHPHYYRLQTPAFVLEFDNSRNGGTHIHSVWRDFAEDFGAGLA